MLKKTMLFCIVGCWMLMQNLTGVTIYVPDDYTTIQGAINAASPGDSIVVRQGTYAENIDFLGKNISLASEAGPSLTVIDGDRNGSVVTFASGELGTCVLRGFTITNGTGTYTPAWDGDCGGGIYCINGSCPTIDGNEIIQNEAYHGGGVFCDDASPDISNNAISGNHAAFTGGGIRCSSNAAPSIAYNMINGNSAGEGNAGSGGGIRCENSCPTITYNDITGNSAVIRGAGIFCRANSNALITHNILTGNTTKGGAGISLEGSSPVISGNVFRDNSADYNGGAITCREGSSPAITNNLFDRNAAGSGRGGAIFIRDTSAPVIGNSTFSGNSAGKDGGGIACDGTSPTIENSILWSNDAPADPQISGGSPVVSYCDVEGGWVGVGNIDADPLFVDEPNSDFRLQQDPCQPGVFNLCVDGGNPATPLCSGTTRTDSYPDTGRIDLGYHSPRQGVWVVPDDFALIQDAIDAASGGDTVFVRQGTYVETIDFSGKAIDLIGLEGADVTIIDGDYMGSPVSFQSGEGSDSRLEGFTVRNGIGTWDPSWSEYCGGGIYCTNQSCPTVTKCTVIENDAYHGGGIFCDKGSHATLTYNLIEGNNARFTGGGVRCCGGSEALVSHNRIIDNRCGDGGQGSGAGVRCENASATITYNYIAGNSAHLRGGGIFCRNGSSGVIAYNVIKDNRAEGGTGINCEESSPLIEGNLISGNYAHQHGGGITCRLYSAPTIINNIIVDNFAEIDAGGALRFRDCYNAQPIVTNNTVVRNHGRQGGAIQCDNSSPIITNTIFWDNTANLEPYEILHKSGFPVITYCDLESGWLGMGNFKADPLFADIDSEDLHITYLSPCRESGNDWAPGLPGKDFEGDPRHWYGHVDVGADEFHTHLYLTGEPVAGGKVWFNIVGEPNSTPVELALGSGIQDPPQVTPYGDLYLVLPIEDSWQFGTIPSNGILAAPTTLPTTLLPGEVYPFQVLLGPYSPGSVLTNLLVMTIE